VEIGSIRVIRVKDLSGLLFARSRDRSGSIVPAVLLHAVYNLTGLLVAAGIGWIITHP